MCVEAADLFANVADLFSHVPADFSSKSLQTIEGRVFDIHHILEAGNLCQELIFFVYFLAISCWRQAFSSNFS